jgi:hypothetical protein
MERPEVQLYLQTPYVGGVLPKTGITVSQGVPSLITYRCTTLKLNGCEGESTS